MGQVLSPSGPPADPAGGAPAPGAPHPAGPTTTATAPVEAATVAPAPGALAALVRRRAAVVARLRAAPDGPALAQAAFATVVALARAPDLDLELALSATGADHRLDLSAALLPAVAPPVSLAQALRGDRLPASAQAALHGLIALGLVDRLAAQAPAARRGWAEAQVDRLPALDRRAPGADFIDFVEAAAAAAQAEAPAADPLLDGPAAQESLAAVFYGAYARRLAAELARRSSDRPVRGPWPLAALVALDDGPTSPAPSPAWRALRRHLERLLETEAGFAAFGSAFFETCIDARLLRALALGPTLSDADRRHALLTGPSPRAAGAALFALRALGPEGLAGAQRCAAHFRGRPLPEVAQRVVDILAQVRLLAAPGPALDSLQRLLLGWLAERALKANLGPILAAVPTDGRALRTSGVLVALAGHPDLAGRPQARQLLERVVATWLRTFTPAGVAHPLNDRGYQVVVGRALAALWPAQGAALAAQVWPALRGLPARVASDLPEGDAAARQLLLARYGVAAVTALRAAAQRLPPAEAQVAWRWLAEVWQVSLGALGSTGELGAEESLLNALLAPRAPGLVAEPGTATTPDPERPAARLDPERPATTPDPERQGADPAEAAVARLFGPEAAHTDDEAALLWALWRGTRPPPDADDGLFAAVAAPAGAVTEASAAAPGGTEGEADGAARAAAAGRGERPVAVRLGHPGGAVADALSVLTGAATVGEVLGWLRAGLSARKTRLWARIAGGQLRVEGDTATGQLSARWPLTQLTGLHIERPLAWLPALWGAGALLGGTFGGGLLWVAGLRLDAPRWQALGLAGVVGGLALGLTLATRARRVHPWVRVVLRSAQGPAVRLEVDAHTGAELLDALMAGEAERRELAGRAAYAAADPTWQAGAEDLGAGLGAGEGLGAG